MSELFIGAAALLVAVPVVWAVARLALWPFLRRKPAPASWREHDENRAASPRPGASTMLTGPIAAVLLVVGVAAYALTLLHLIARDVQRARWQREFDGWRIVQRQRITRRLTW